MKVWSSTLSGQGSVTGRCERGNVIWGSVKDGGIALGYGLDDWEFDSRQGLEVVRFTTVSRLVLGPTHPLQWVPGALSLR
jgi:hypothetical protein